MKIILMRHDSLFGPVAIYAMEPPNKGHVGTRSFGHYREIPFIWRLKCNGIIGIGLSFIERCSLFRVSFIGGSTVLCPCAIQFCHWLNLGAHMC